MSTATSGTVRVLVDPTVRVFDNGSAVLVRPEIPDWIRTSEVGAWIFESLRSEPRAPEEIVTEVAARYSLPEEAVREPTLRLLEALVDQGYAEAAPVAAADPVAAAAPSEKRTRPSPPRLEDLDLRQLWIHVTSRCNLRCRYCYYRVEHPGRELSLETAHRLFSEAAALGVNQIILSGGEPMLHPRILDLVRACREASNWTLKLVSNGTMPEGGTFDRIIELIDDLQISVDGADARTHDAIRGAGSFARAVKTFKHLHETKAGVHRGIAFTPTPENVDEIPRLNKLAYHLGADYIHLNHPKLPSDPESRAAMEAAGFLGHDFLRSAITGFRRLYVNLLSDRKDASGLRYRSVYLDSSFSHAVSLIHILRHDTCGAGITTLGFDPDGAAYPCAALTGRAGCHLGTFPERTLDELRRAGRMWNRGTFSVDRDPVCGSCLYRYFCGGGCRALAGTPSERDASCPVLLDCFDEFLKYVSLPENHVLYQAASEESERRRNHARPDGCTEA